MKLRSLVAAPLLVLAVALAHCGGIAADPGAGPLGSPEGGAGADGGAVGADGGATTPNPDAVGATTSSRVDLLLVVDNSASMGDKANALAASVDPLLRSLATSGDLHVGVITTSLGSMGGDVCPDATPGLNGLAHLFTTGVPSAAAGFLSYGAGDATDLDALVADTQSLVKGVGQMGCGLEAQLESAYRFLVQPDPWQSVTRDPSNRAQLVGVDSTVLAQRKAFLRDDSLVVVLMLTDEDDSAVDPLSIAGQGWAFEALKFPGSTVARADGQTTTAPRASSACATNPIADDCTSCGYAATCDLTMAPCQKVRNDPECQRNGGYYGPTEDSINVRFQRMKERYGIDPQFPIARYVDGFTKSRAPDRAGEHVVDDQTISAYVGDADCTNPLFATSLPSSAADELCHLPQGPRGKELVVFAVIGGVPETLTANGPDWTKILGTDPAGFDFSGQDVHMIQSVTPRSGLPAPSATRGDDGDDPVSGREWDTNGSDLQYACTFALVTPHSCTIADTSCDCADTSSNPPLCGATIGQQTRGKAYPTIRELRVARELGDRGVAGSICPADAALGYVSTLKTLGDRLALRIRN